MVIWGILATVFTCSIAFITFLAPKQAQTVIYNLYSVETATPQVIVQTVVETLEVIVTQSPQPTYTFAPSEVLVVTATEPPPTPTLQPSNTPAQITLFEDNFDFGRSQLWQVLSGNPIVVNEQLTSNDESWLIIGDSSWTNYEVSFDAILRNSCSSSNALLLGLRIQGQSVDNMFALQIGVCNSKWYFVEDGVWSQVPNSDFNTPGTGPFRIKIRILNDQLSLFVDEVRISSFFDGKYVNGPVALGLKSTTIVDNFFVKQSND